MLPTQGQTTTDAQFKNVSTTAPTPATGGILGTNGGTTGTAALPPTPPVIPIDTTILGMTDQEFNARYWRSRNPKIRAVETEFEHVPNDENAQKRCADMAALAQGGLLLDAQIEGWVGRQGSPAEFTRERLALGTKTVSVWSGDAMGDPGQGELPVPPDLTPYPDPPVATHEFVAGLKHTRGYYTAKGLPDPGGDVYEATFPRGWQTPLNGVVTEFDAAGSAHLYRRIGQIESGDFEAQYVLLG